MDSWSTPYDGDGPSASPPSERVVTIVQFLAADPERAFTLAEVARARAMNKATCRSVLAELVRWGWAIRDPANKTYTLGPALLSVGRAAERAFPALRHARIVVREVVDRHGLPAVIAAQQGTQLAILDTIGDLGRLGDNYRSGQLVPFMPPWGAGFLAWGPRADQEAWLGRSETPVTDEDRTWYARVFASIRARHYGVDRLNATAVEMRKLLPALTVDPLATDVAPAVHQVLRHLGSHPQVIDELRPGARFPVALLYAPVFGPDARPSLNLSVHLLREDVPFEEVEVIAADLVAAARVVTTACGGRVPSVGGH